MNKSGKRKTLLDYFPRKPVISDSDSDIIEPETTGKNNSKLKSNPPVSSSPVIRGDISELEDTTASESDISIDSSDAFDRSVNVTDLEKQYSSEYNKNRRKNPADYDSTDDELFVNLEEFHKDRQAKLRRHLFPDAHSEY